MVELEGSKLAAAFAHMHTNVQEEEDREGRHELDVDHLLDGEAKRQMLINELMTYRLARDELANEN